MFFDRRDYKLIEIVNSVYNEPKTLGYTRKLFYPFFHPLGIKELAESRGLRTAFSIVNLLESMERGDISGRLTALAGLRDDILDTADGPMPKNTARVLLQIMKDLVRAKGDFELQRRLAHDFRMAAFGKPKVVRKFLDRYHLLEMPEAWNQITFDDHVHDANTSGRKSPTHLIMDAWIKGIRRLRVIYHHYIEPKFALELIEAAGIMEIDLRIGIEFWALHRGRYVSFIWVSRGLPDPESFLCFLAQPHVAEFMAGGKAVLHCQQAYLLDLLSEFNRIGRERMGQDFGMDMMPVDGASYLSSTAPGQPSLENLGEYIHGRAVKALDARIASLQEQSGKAGSEDKEQLRALTEKRLGLTVRQVLDDYLAADAFFDNFRSYVNGRGSEVPERPGISFRSLLDRIDDLHHDYRITLNLDRLTPADVLELLYKSRGRITRIEIINLKKFRTTDMACILCVNELQKSINQGSLLKLKRVIAKIIDGVEDTDACQRQHRLDALHGILHDIDELKHMYGVRPLRLRIGSDSSGKAHQAYGMGFAVVDTLAAGARRKIRRDAGRRLLLPVSVRTTPRITILPNDRLPRLLRHIPGLTRKGTDWNVGPFLLEEGPTRNLLTLGSGQWPGPARVKDRWPAAVWNTLNTRLKNALKILAGFVPAQICFAVTKEWWVLAWCGAAIWFGITSVRNILQSVFGSGGMKRAARLKWNDYVSWDRLADSLLFTGFSVPLLDWVVKVLLLERALGITMANGPFALYSVMGLANGIYLSSHNFFRGLPKGAVTGNFFRSILAIPVALAINAVLGWVLGGWGVADIASVLQKWAAIISKAASDIVAGVIEGTADRFQNTRRRRRDIQRKISDLYQTYSKLVLLFPETHELDILKRPEILLEHKNSEVRDLATLIIINSLDLFYFWMYLPRARAVMTDMVSRMTPEERIIFFQSQDMLRHEQYISRLFVDGVLGRNFSKPLSFYLTSYRHYLNGITGARRTGSNSLQSTPAAAEKGEYPVKAQAH